MDEMKLGGGNINKKVAARTLDIKSTRPTPGPSTHPHQLTSITVKPHHTLSEGQFGSPPACAPWTQPAFSSGKSKGRAGQTGNVLKGAGLRMSR